MISSEAEHPNCMYLWMNHIISPEANAAGGGVVRRGAGEREVVRPHRQPARRLRGTEDHCEVFHADDEEFFDQIEYWKTPVSDCGDDRGDDCKTYDEWVQGWNEVKG